MGCLSGILSSSPQAIRVEEWHMGPMKARFEVETIMGEGAQACVYKGVDRFTSVAVAIKVSRLPHPLEQLCRCVPLLTMIPREPTVMQRFRDVPGIPPILCISVARRHIAFAMPLYETSVAQWVASHGPLSEPHAAAVLRGLLEIVAKLHEKHVVHRDIKPDNVMLDLAQCEPPRPARKVRMSSGVFNWFSAHDRHQPADRTAPASQHAPAPATASQRGAAALSSPTRPAFCFKSGSVPLRSVAHEGTGRSSGGGRLSFGGGRTAAALAAQERDCCGGLTAVAVEMPGVSRALGGWHERTGSGEGVVVGVAQAAPRQRMSEGSAQPPEHVVLALLGSSQDGDSNAHAVVLSDLHPGDRPATPTLTLTPLLERGAVAGKGAGKGDASGAGSPVSTGKDTPEITTSSCAPSANELASGNVTARYRSPSSLSGEAEGAGRPAGGTPNTAPAALATAMSGETSGGDGDGAEGDGDAWGEGDESDSKHAARDEARALALQASPSAPRGSPPRSLALLFRRSASFKHPAAGPDSVVPPAPPTSPAPILGMPPELVEALSSPAARRRSTFGPNGASAPEEGEGVASGKARHLWEIVRLVDFGCAAKAHKRRPEKGYVAGSPGYVPPEALKGAGHLEPYDIYSCGATLFYVLTGTLPFTEYEILSLNYRHIPIERAINIKSPDSPFHKLSEPCKAFLMKLLSGTPANRPTAVEALADPWLVSASEAFGS